MNGKERLSNLLSGNKPDRLPLYISLTPQIAEKLSNHLNMEYEPPLDSMLSTRISHPELLKRMGVDILGVAACSPSDNFSKDLGNGISVNEWGMVFKNAGLYNEFYEFPLANAETKNDIVNFSFPKTDAAGRFDYAKKIITENGKSYGIVGDLETTLFETAWYLTGLEKFLLDLMIEAPYIDPLLDGIMEFHLEVGKRLVELGVDILWAGDDFGTQTDLIMPPETWAKYFKPRMAYMFQEFKKVNPDVKIAWHTCGAVDRIIPQMIEIGLDILNPIQPLAKGMDPQYLSDTYGDELIFFGGIDVQNLLPFAEPKEIRNEIQRRIKILNEGKGFIVAPAHNIQPDTPLENIFALIDAVKNI